MHQKTHTGQATTLRLPVSMSSTTNMMLTEMRPLLMLVVVMLMVTGILEVRYQKGGVQCPCRKASTGMQGAGGVTGVLET